MSALTHWRDRVLRHLAQADAAQVAPDGLPLDEDAWEQHTGAFKADPRREGDPVVERIARELDADSTLLDVGGGAGRLALPLALRCRRVTVVDSSEAMLEALSAGAAAAGIDNVAAVNSTWPIPDLEAAEVVLCAHVVYTEPDIADFIRSLDRHAEKAVLMPTFELGPQAHLGLLWPGVYGEDRVGLPGLPELVAVLEEMGIAPEVETVESLPPRTYRDAEAVVKQVRSRMYVRPDGDRDRKLRRTVEELLVEHDGGYRLAGAVARTVALVRWSAGRLEPNA